jgi:hypothetical protein
LSSFLIPPTLATIPAHISLRLSTTPLIILKHNPSGQAVGQFVSFDVVLLFTKVIIPLKHSGNYRVFVEESSRLTLFSSACARNTHTICRKETQSCISVVMPRIVNT